MKVTKSVKHHVSMGNYEWVEFGAEIEAEVTKLRPEDNQKLSEGLEMILADEIREARLNTAEKKSYIHIYRNEEE